MKNGLFSGKKLLLASPFVHFVGERSSSFSRRRRHRRVRRRRRRRRRPSRREHDYMLAPHRTGSTSYFSNTLGIVRSGWITSTLWPLQWTVVKWLCDIKWSRQNGSFLTHALAFFWSTTLVGCLEAAAVLHLRTVIGKIPVNDNKLVRTISACQPKPQPTGYRGRRTKLITMQ